MIHRRVLWGAIVATLLIGVAVASLYSGWRLRATLRPEHMPVRKMAILSQAAQQRYDTIIIGDSMVELAEISGLCGRTLNAGIGGARVADIVKFAPAAIWSSGAKRVIVVVGVNDAARRHQTPPDEFDRGLTALAEAAQKAGASIAFGTIAPINSKMPTGAAISASRIVELDAVIKRRSSVVPLGAQFPNGLDQSQTSDGVHLSAEGYKPWLAGLRQGCAVH